MLIPVNAFGFNDEGMIEFNEIYHYCLENTENGNFKEFEIAPSGSIRTAIGTNRGARWQLIVKKTFIEIVIKNLDARYYRFQIGHKKDKQETSGRKAFTIYQQELLKDGVDLKSLAIDNGEEVKKTIPSPKIDLLVAPDRVYENAFHIDYNNAFHSGIITSFPVLEPTTRRLNEKKKTDPEIKNVFTMTQGFMQSALVGYKYAHISKAGYVWTNNKLDEITEKLKASGYRILAYNTDGIWYQSFTGQQYHDEDEGTDLCQWKTDWINCKIRFRSKGCYEVEGYEVKGDKVTYKYKPIFRGESSYEKIVPREQWVWGDIYKGDVVQYKWKDGIGVVKDAD